MLRAWGCEPTSVASGEAALAALAEARAAGAPYRLALLDVGMPGLDGFALVEKIREAPSGAEGPPAIVMMLVVQQPRRGGGALPELGDLALRRQAGGPLPSAGYHPDHADAGRGDAPGSRATGGHPRGAAAR